MTAKAENRYKKLNRRQIDAEFLKDELLLRRSIEALTAEAECKIAALESENAKFKVALEKARYAYHRRCLEVEAESTERRAALESAEYWHRAFQDCLKQRGQIQKQHQKLSMIVRIGITPDHYRELRECAAEIYPELFDAETGE